MPLSCNVILKYMSYIFLILKINKLCFNSYYSWDDSRKYFKSFIYIIFLCLIFPLFSTLLRYNWHIRLYKFQVCNVMVCSTDCVKLRYTVWWFCISIYCKMITMIRLVNSFIIVCVCVCVCVWWEHLKFTFLTTFKYTILTIVTMLYIRSPELIHLLTADIFW